MNIICKSSLCVENVRESNVLTCRRLVDVPGVDAIQLSAYDSVELRVCEVSAVAAVAVGSHCWKDSGSLAAERAAAGTC